MKSILWHGLYWEFKYFDTEFIYSASYLEPHKQLKKYLLSHGYAIRYLTDDPFRSCQPQAILFSDLPLSAVKVSDSLKTLIRKYRELISNYIKFKCNILSKDLDRTRPGPRNILLLWESPAVYPENYISRNHELFDLVLTQNDELVDNKKYVKLYQPIAIPPTFEIAKSFRQKKFSVMINSNKYSNVPGELYSARRSIVEEFDKNFPGQLAVYGQGWESTLSNLGVVRDKNEILPNFKYTICYENSSVGVGYISEKIFDCFICGTVPIYWGAPNIAEHLPEDLFIDRRHFKDNRSLILFLYTISEKQYDGYIERAREYLLSARSYKWTIDNFCNTILKSIVSKHPCSANESSCLR